MTRKKFITIAIGISSTLLLLFIVLVVHIALVTNPKSKTHYGIQLSRIDFKSPQTPNDIEETIRYLKAIPGVGSTMYNSTYNNIVFAHDLSVISGKEAFVQLKAHKHINATRFQLSKEEISKVAVCPVVNNESMMMTLARQIQKFFL